MSRVLEDLSKKSPQSLNEDERRYLQDRGQLPEGATPVRDNLADPGNINDTAHTGDANTAGLSVDQLEKMLASAREREKEEGGPRIGDAGGIDEDDEETYATDDGWNNDKRRAELARRGLSVDGDMDDLIARLRQSDLDQAEEDEDED